MQIFMSHSSLDKDVVEPIGSFLTAHGLTVWIDTWQMTPGDSLIEKIGEGIEKSDRLVVCLTPNSSESNWVKKEVATGLVMELAEDKGLGSNFVIPALLVPCKVPIMLRDKLYANFTNKAFDAACAELLSGLTNAASGPNNATLENKILRTYNMISQNGKHALVIEFGVRVSPAEGLHIVVDVGAPYTGVTEWLAPPNRPQMPSIIGLNLSNTSERREPPIFERVFKAPAITSTLSYYVHFESEIPFDLKQVVFLDGYDRKQ